MKKKQGHGNQCEESGFENPVDQCVTEDTTHKKEAVRQEVPAQEDTSGVFQTNHTFEQDEWYFENSAVIPIMGVEHLVQGAFSPAREVVERRDANLALVPCIQRSAVVVEHKRGHKQEERTQDQQRPVGNGQPPARKRDAHGMRPQTGPATAMFISGAASPASGGGRASASAISGPLYTNGRALTPGRAGRNPRSRAAPPRRTGPCGR